MKDLPETDSGTETRWRWSGSKKRKNDTMNDKSEKIQFQIGRCGADLRRKNGRYGGITLAVKLLLAAFAFGVALMLPQPQLPAEVSASFDATLLQGRDPEEKITNDDRDVAYRFLLEHIERLRTLNDLSPEAEQRVQDVMYEANVFIANTDLTVGQLADYVNLVEGDLSEAANHNVMDAYAFLFVSNNSSVTYANYGQATTLTFGLVNLGKADVTDVVITPIVSNDVSKWPFVIQNSQDARIIDRIRASEVMDEAQALRREVSWDFVVAGNAKTGTYPLNFHLIYYRNGSIEERDVTTYIHIKGAPGAGSLIEEEKPKEEEVKLSTPRIIVTGFTTDPETVNAGDTFNLTITVQNTSSETAVSNIQFDLKAAQEGEKDENTYEAFLPTSGSATIFVPSIAAGDTTDISIEMTARGDLAQKPYVITVNAAYEDYKHNAYTAATNVSIPVRQPARVDTGDAEILPDVVELGNSSNIMFPIHNMGKTTLYNVQVSFQGDSIEGGNTFLGKIEPGASGNVDAMVNAVYPTMDDGTIIALISYEDESGNVTTFEKELDLWVIEPEYEEFPDDYGFEDPDMMDGEKSGPPKALIFGGIGGGIAIGVIVGIIVAANKKKKKRAAELAALEDDE